MSRDIKLLDDSFRTHVEILLDRCATDGLPMRIFVTERDVFEQAKLWRQSRTRQQVEAKIKELRHVSANFLADVIESVGPQLGRWATNAIPGLSWHQYGLAVDCFALDNGNAVWESGAKHYTNYAVRAQELGLTPGHFWTARDSVHVQAPQENSPLEKYTLEQISDIMEKKFGRG